MIRAGAGEPSSHEAHPPQSTGLSPRYVAGRESLRSLDDRELDPLALIQRLISVGLYRRIVDEDIFPAIAHYESVPLCCIEPFYRTDLSQCLSLLFPDY
jgi:hypothetical protein